MCMEGAILRSISFSSFSYCHSEATDDGFVMQHLYLDTKVPVHQMPFLLCCLVTAGWKLFSAVISAGSVKNTDSRWKALLPKAEAWTWNCAIGMVCASTLCFYFSLDGKQQHTRTKGKLGRELPSKWPFSPFAGGGGKPLSFTGSRTQVSKQQNKVSGVKEGESLGCVRGWGLFQSQLSGKQQ